MSYNNIMNIDVFERIAKKLDVESYEQFASANRLNYNISKVLQNSMYKYFLKRDFDMTVPPYVDPKSYYFATSIYQSSVRVNVIYNWEESQVPVPIYDADQLPEGMTFMLPRDQATLSFVQQKIFELTEDLDVFWMENGNARIKCYVSIASNRVLNQKGSFYFWIEKTSRPSFWDTLTINVAQTEERPIVPNFTWENADEDEDEDKDEDKDLSHLFTVFSTADMDSDRESDSDMDSDRESDAETIHSSNMDVTSVNSSD